MPNDREHDRSLRSAIRELRAADGRDAPSFDAVLAHRRARRPATLPIGALAVAAVLVFGAGVGVVYRPKAQPERLTLPSEVIALSTWRPMTDVLLETPNRTLLGETPRLGASLIALNYNGDLR